ncbi:MAG: helix-turn-helix transcriptional regulator [Clostridia bacterium]|nr:helix-turn-helix transcriptional regulator [Clostridia bacterium]
MAISAEILGKRLKKARKQKKLTQEYIAEKIDLSIEHLGRIENGKKPIYLHKFGLWCDALDVPAEEILSGAAIPANSEYNRQFGEIAKGCSQETVAAMLDICRRIAEVEQRERERHSET